MHSAPTLSTAHASRTRVKAPQTDFHVKPYNSSGPTHDSPSERPLRTKVTFQHKKAPKKASRKAMEHQTARRPHKPGTDRLSSMLLPARNRGQGPKGSIETKTASTSMPRAMDEASKHQIGSHGSRHAHRSRQGFGLGDWFASLSLERKILSFFLSLISIYLEYLPIRIKLYI